MWSSWRARQGRPMSSCFFDGRVVSSRKYMSGQLEGARDLREVRIAYHSTKLMGRCVVWSADSREVAWISVPVARTVLAIKERREKTATWGGNTRMAPSTRVSMPCRGTVRP